MSTENPPHPSQPLPDAGRPTGYRCSLRQYEHMVATGMLGPTDRVELLEGTIVAMTPIGSEHAVAVMLAQQAIGAPLPDGWIVRAGQPITLADSQPEPDVAVVRGAIRDYTRAHPSPDRVALAIEVSDTSLRLDRERTPEGDSDRPPVAPMAPLGPRDRHRRRCDRPAGELTMATAKRDTRTRLPPLRPLTDCR